MPDQLLETLLGLHKAQGIGPQPTNAFGQDLPLPPSKDIPGQITNAFLGMLGLNDKDYVAGNIANLLSFLPLAKATKAVEPLMGITAKGKAAMVPEKVAPLATDYASRMARAKEMGYTTDVYHGTKPQAMIFEGNKSPGVKPNATFNEFEFKRKPYGDAGIHVDPDPNVANVGAATNIDASDKFNPNKHVYKQGANVMPLKAKMQKTLDLLDMGIWSDPSRWHSMLDPESTDPILEQLYLAADRAVKESYLTVGNRANTRELWAEKFKNILKQNGYDSIRYPNKTEGTGGYSYMLLEPNQLRSRNAMFDPARAKSGDLLAVTDQDPDEPIQKLHNYIRGTAATLAARKVKEGVENVAPETKPYIDHPASAILDLLRGRQ